MYGTEEKSEIVQVQVVLETPSNQNLKITNSVKQSFLSRDSSSRPLAAVLNRPQGSVVITSASHAIEQFAPVPVDVLQINCQLTVQTDFSGGDHQMGHQ